MTRSTSAIPHPEVLAQARTSARKKAALRDLLNSDATRCPPTGRCRPPISVTAHGALDLCPSVEHQQPMFRRLGNFIRFSPRTNAVQPGRNDQPRDPLDFSATSPLPRPLSGHTSHQGRSVMNPGENSRQLQITPPSPSPFTPRIHNVSSLWPVRRSHPQPRIVDVPLAQAKERNAAAGAPKKDEDIVPDEYLDPPSPNPNSQQPAAAVQTCHWRAWR
ncbi:hypothetical protein EDD22DRAFT_186147 [Suillus occidentalis]|nr:hypothetical protein EDD22DRAFT_186147 [Suillus occidentalis]